MRYDLNLLTIFKSWKFKYVVNKYIKNFDFFVLILVCDPDCPSDYEPLCGSNEQTYLNECLMRLDACFKDEEIISQYDGPCRGTMLAPSKKKKYTNFFRDE